MTRVPTTVAMSTPFAVAENARIPRSRVCQRGQEPHEPVPKVPDPYGTTAQRLWSSVFLHRQLINRRYHRPMSTQLPTGPLSGLTVIDMATIFAGPSACRHLGDFGA